MLLLSIDVGIKNLSFCLFELTNDNETISILKWNNINLGEMNEHKCIAIDKNKQLCNKPSKFYNNMFHYYCLKHSKQLTNYILPQKELKETYIKKQKINELHNICNKYEIKYESFNKKNDLVHLLVQYSNNKCLKEVVKCNSTKVDLVTIGRNIQYKFDNELDGYIDSINTIIIENQIGPIANKMKTIQGMISQYFIMKNNNISIDFISATNKLKDFIDTNTKSYKERKKIGIEICSQFVSNDERFITWKDYYSNSKKKDDLSDCFLQGMWYIQHKIK
jgi:hypothetical protein